MARAAGPTPPKPKVQLSGRELRRGIERLDERIAELKGFDLGLVPNGSSPELTALEAAVQDTLIRCFGEDTAAARRFASAASLQFRPMMFGDNYPLRQHYVEGAQEAIARSVALLGEAKRVVNEDLAEVAETQAQPPQPAPPEAARSRRVFVVHGHDGEAKEAVARFLGQIGFEPVILHEQASRGRTVIEKVEANSDVGFAVVLLTPDDTGAANGATPQPRARQNVILELGYFVGKLRRENVCALKRGEVEVPSDFGGVVYTAFDDAGAWRTELGRELQAAGYAIDWNKVFRP